MTHNASRSALRPARAAARALRVIACGLALAGCARGDSDAVTLRVTSWQSPEENAIDAANWREFERRHPGVHVVNDPVTNQAEYREKVVTSIAAGAPPDVFLLDGIDAAAFADEGVLLDLAPFAARVGISLDSFYPEVLAHFTRPGQLLAFPKGLSPMVYYYNRDLFDAAGLPYPAGDWTRDDFLRAARALTRDTNGDGAIDQWGTALDRRFFAWQAWVWSGGGDILSPDGTRATGYLDSPETDSTVAFLTALPTAYGVAPRPNAFRAVSGTETRLFYSGKLAMYTSGHWLIPQLRRHVARGRVRLGVAPVPRAEGHPSRTVLFASGYAVPHNTPHRKLAVEFAAWMASPEAQRHRLGSGLELATMPVVQSAFVAADTTGLERAFVALVPTGRPPWGARIARFREVEAQMYDVLDRVLINGESVHDVTSSVARRIDAILAR